MFSPQSRLRHAVADTFAMVVYCSVVNMLIEIFLSGMTFEQSLSSRLGRHSGQYFNRVAPMECIVMRLCASRVRRARRVG